MPATGCRLSLAVQEKVQVPDCEEVDSVTLRWIDRQEKAEFGMGPQSNNFTIYVSPLVEG